MTKKLVKRLSIVILCILMLIGIMVTAMGCEEEVNEEEVNGKFCTLQEAYDAGWLTQQELLIIAYYHNGGIKGNEEVFPQDYVPILKGYLDDNVVKEIKQTYLNQFYSNEKKTSTKDVFIDQFYGTYGGRYGCVALVMIDNYSGTAAVIRKITVAGVQFTFYGREILVWKKIPKSKL